MTSSQKPSPSVERELDAARANKDPVSGTPGSHPVGTGVGAVMGGTVGLGIGAAVGGPVGAAVGAAVGAVAGGLTGKTAAEVIDPTIEEAYWRSNYKTRPYVDSMNAFDVYAPAYRFGWESRMKRKDQVKRSFDDLEHELATEWKKAAATTSLAWDKAKLAARDAWDRISIDRAEGEGMSSSKAANCDTTKTSTCDGDGNTKSSASGR